MFLCPITDRKHSNMSWNCAGSLRVASQGLSRPFLKTFASVFPDPTERLCRVSEDVPLASFALCKSIVYASKRRSFCLILFFFSLLFYVHFHLYSTDEIHNNSNNKCNNDAFENYPLLLWGFSGVIKQII